MEEEEKKSRGKQLLEEIRRGRGFSTNERSGRIIQGSRGTSTPPGPASENTGADTGRTSGNEGGTGSHDRSTEERTQRSGQDNRRLEHNSRELADRGSEVRRVGLSRGDIGETSNPLVEPPKHSNLRHTKEQAENVLSSIKDAVFAKKGSVFTKKEAEESFEPLKAAIQDNGDSMDKMIVWWCGNIPLEATVGLNAIWGSITDFEAEAAAKLWINRATKDPYAAEAARKMIASKDYVAAIIMAAPRVQLTVEAKRQAERIKRENKNK